MSLGPGDRRQVHIETFGCQMNEYDSEVVRALLTREGYVMRIRVAWGGIVGFRKDKSKRFTRSGKTENDLVSCKVSYKEVIP